MQAARVVSPGAIYGVLLALIGCHAFGVFILPAWVSGSFVFLKRTWGFHFWSFYPAWLAIAAYVIAVVGVWPPVQEWMIRSLCLSPSTREWMGRHRTVVWVAAGVLSWVVFWTFRQKYGLLGDGYLRATDIRNGQIPTEEVGSMGLLVGLYKVLSVWRDDPVLTMQVFSVFWGGLYVFLVCVWCDRVGRSGVEKVLVGALLLLVGIVQYFFGYIEVYAPMPVFFMGFVICGSLALWEWRSPLWATLIFAVGTMMHVMMAAVFPGLLYIWYVWAVERWPNLKRAFWFGIGACFLSGLLGYGWLSRTATLHVHWLPFWATEGQPYAVLTLAHFWEWLNAQILGGPMVWPLMGLVGALWIRDAYRWDSTVQFLGLVSVGYLLGSVVLDFVLGSRDWDLWCFMGLPLTVLVTWGLTQIEADSLSSETRRYVLGCAVVLTALNTLPWIGMNHTDRSLARTMQSLDGDPGTYYRKHPADLVLGMLFSDLSESHAMRAYQRGFERHPDDARFAYNIGVQHFRAGRFEAAIEYGERAVALLPGYLAACRLLAFAYDELRVDRQALHYGALYLELGGQDADVTDMMADILNRLGELAIQREEPARAIVLYRYGLDLGLQDVGIHLALAQLYRNQGAEDSARVVLESARVFAPDDASVLQALKRVAP